MSSVRSVTHVPGCTRLTIVAAALLAAPAMAEEKPELAIYTYESFVSEWGPGPAIAASFEKECDCAVRFVGAGDGPCVVMMLGARLPEGDIVYPVSEPALEHGAGVEHEAHDPRDAYADLPPPHYERLPELGLPWQ